MSSHNHGSHHEPAHSHGHGHVDEDMLSVEQAYDRVMARFQTLEFEEKALLDCMGQVLAEDIKSPLALPPLANSGMDGYALRHSDIVGASHENPKNLEVVGIVAAVLGRESHHGIARLHGTQEEQAVGLGPGGRAILHVRHVEQLLAQFRQQSLSAIQGFGASVIPCL